MRNAKRLVLDLNSCRCLYFLQQKPLHHESTLSLSLSLSLYLSLSLSLPLSLSLYIYIYNHGDLYGSLSPISKTIQVRRTIHAGDCWRGKDELISGAILRPPTLGRANVGWPWRTYLYLLRVDTDSHFEDRPRAIDDDDVRREQES